MAVPSIVLQTAVVAVAVAAVLAALAELVNPSSGVVDLMAARKVMSDLYTEHAGLDGKMSTAELKLALTAEGATDELIVDILEQADSNGDGFVDLSEFGFVLQIAKQVPWLRIVKYIVGAFFFIFGAFGIGVAVYLGQHPDCPMDITYERGKKLGEGSFGTVYEATLRTSHPTSWSPEEKIRRLKRTKRHGAHHGMHDSQRFALKFLHIQELEEATEGVMESLRLVNCQHPNVVGVREQFFCNRYSEMGWWERLTTSPFQLCIVMELCHGDLCDRIRDWAENDTDEELKCKLLTQTVSAVKCIHDHDLIHRDLKPENIFITEDGDVKVGDLGLACRDTEAEDSSAGTPGYIAPELWGFMDDGSCVDDYTDRVDVWSIGCIVVDVACPQQFVAGDCGSAAYRIVDTCDDLATDPENDDYDISNVALRTPLALESVLRAEEISAVPRFKRLVERCLVVEADRRADCEELLEILDPEKKYML